MSVYVAYFWRSLKKRLPLRNSLDGHIFPPDILSDFFLFVEAELFWGGGVVDLVGLKLERNIHITEVVIHKIHLL